VAIGPAVKNRKPSSQGEMKIHPHLASWDRIETVPFDANAPIIAYTA
jgi:hypothetical protein